MSPRTALALVSSLVVGCGGSGQATAPGPDASSGEDRTMADGTSGGLDVARPSADGALPGDAGAPPADAGADAARCSGKTATRRGLTQRSVTAGGVKRTYLVYLPALLDPNQPLPLVFVHHGYTMSGQAMHDITLYAALADKEGVAVAFPDGESGPNGAGPPWNVGTGVCGNGAFEQATGDDFSFIVAMRADIEQDQCVDGAHVFLTGFSMGGYFANQVGCMRPDLVRAVAPASGGTHDFSTCVPGHKPVILFHGTADPVIAESCGTQARDYWVTKNGCSTTVQTQAVDGGSCEISQGCPADGQVELCLFTGMGHAWAGGAPNLSFSAPNYESATELEWAFFKAYAW